MSVKQFPELAYNSFLAYNSNEFSNPASCFLFASFRSKADYCNAVRLSLTALLQKLTNRKQEVGSESSLEL